MLCDHIENTSFHAFFSFDAVSTLSRLLNTDGTGTIRRKSSTIDLSAYTRRAMAAVRSWEFNEINVVFSNKREEIEKTIEQNILSQLLYAIISADVAMTSATKSRIMIANEGNEILEQLLIKSTDQTNETVKLFAQIASEKWQVLKSGQISSLWHSHGRIKALRVLSLPD